MLRRLARLNLVVLIFLAGLAIAPGAMVHATETNPFQNGWTLDGPASELHFISVKKGNIAEINNFGQLSGAIDDAGNASVSVVLNSLETYIDIRNVRLRFLLFQTYLFPTARISLRIDRGLLDDLVAKRRKVTSVDYTLEMHGEHVTRPARIALTLIDENRVVVSNTDPIIVGVSDFGLYDGVRRLEEAANVDVSPLAIVSFDFTFTRNPAAQPSAPTAGAMADATAPARISAWNENNPDLQSCMARVLQLSRLSRVRFDARSARIDGASAPLMQAYAETLNRCPTIRIRITGQTGPGEGNVASGSLGMQRAQAVSRYLWSRGVQRSRMDMAGGGHAKSGRPGRILFTLTD